MTHPSTPTTWTPVVGDLVHVGNGKKTWQVVEFWTAPSGEPMAALIPSDGGYTAASAAVTRLVRE